MSSHKIHEIEHTPDNEIDDKTEQESEKRRVKKASREVDDAEVRAILEDEQECQFRPTEPDRPSGSQSQTETNDSDTPMEGNPNEVGGPPTENTGALTELNEQERKTECLSAVSSEQVKPAKPEIEQKRDFGEIRIGPPILSNPFKYKCNMCKRPFDSYESLKRHTHRKIKRPPVKCDVCGKISSSSSSLATHKRIHTGDKRYQCDKCGKTFVQRAAMLSHIRGAHTKEKPYTCDQCGRTFSHPTTMKAHRYTHHDALNHKDLKKLQCEVCGKISCTPQALKLHMCVHTGEKPYQCKVCSKRFTAPGSVYVHMRLHTGVRPYKCQYCDQEYTHESNLTAHIRSRHRK